MSVREERKVEHLQNALSLPDGPLSAGFDDVHLMHDCLPGLNISDIDLHSVVGGIYLPQPIFINAITGGTASVKEINRDLALVAREAGIAMAIGSQMAAVRDSSSLESYRIARETNPEGIIFANVSAFASVDEAERAVDMLEAQALQIHLNAAQELVMAEGDRNFSSCLTNIENIVNALHVPVFVKETGCGMSAEAMTKLLSTGVSALDVAGAGGTNFPAIEAMRKDKSGEELSEWGIPTVVTLAEAAKIHHSGVSLIASGGVRSSLDVLKSLALGADAVGMAGNILAALKLGGVEGTVALLQERLQKLREMTLLTGAKNIRDLRKVRLYFTGHTYQALQCLGHDLPLLCRQR